MTLSANGFNLLEFANSCLCPNMSNMHPERHDYHLNCALLGVQVVFKVGEVGWPRCDKKLGSEEVHQAGSRDCKSDYLLTA